MQCQNARELFSDYISEEIEPALVVTMESHLSSCLNCREEVDGLRQLWRRLDQVDLVEAPSALHEQIMSRVAAAQNEAAPAVASNRWRWDWRSLMQPRALALAAVLLIVALAGVEAVQTQRASLGPLGFIVRLLHPAAAPTPGLQTLRGEWVPNAQGGALVLHLQPARSAEGRDSSIPYSVQIAGVQSAPTQGALVSDQETTLRIPVSHLPAGDALHVSVLTPAEGDSLSREIVVPLPQTPTDADQNAPVVPNSAQ